MPNLTALAHRASDFKYSIWLQRWATLHMAFGVAVQLVAGFVGLKGIWRSAEEGAVRRSLLVFEELHPGRTVALCTEV